jgi:hypothetical protein
MKKILILLLLFVSGFCIAQVTEEEMEMQQNDMDEFDEPVEQEQQQQTFVIPSRENLVIISKGDLPDAVENSFSDGFFSNWNVIETFRIPTEVSPSEPAYIIDVEQDGVVMTLHYNEAGQLLYQQKRDPLTGGGELYREDLKEIEE